MKTINIIINFVNYCGQQLITWFIDDNIDFCINIPEYDEHNQIEWSNTHLMSFINTNKGWFVYKSNLKKLYDNIENIFKNAQQYRIEHIDPTFKNVKLIINKKRFF